MKKTFTTILMAMACMAVFTACDEDITDLFTDDDVLGNITLTTSNANGPQLYANDTTLQFKSALCNVNMRNVSVSVNVDELDFEYDTSNINVNAGAIFVGVTGNNITSNTSNIDWPVCGINLRDTLPGSYFVCVPVTTFEFLNYIDTTSINSMITAGLQYKDLPFNLFAVAAGREAYYIGYRGFINVTAFGGNGTMVEGTINNLKAYYITLDQIRALLALTPEERSQITLAETLSSVTFNGSFSSLRANMTSVINRLNDLDEVDITK